MRGADATLQQQMDWLLKGMYNVSVFTNTAATREQLGNTGNGGQPGPRQRSLSLMLWLGAVHLHGSSRKHEGAFNLTRNPTPVQHSMPTVLLEDRLTVITKPGVNHVRLPILDCIHASLAA
jgi:hypothetical protein